MAFDVLSPDGISINPVETYPTRAAAESALRAWVGRFEWQGFYSTSRWERIQLDEIAGRCRIVEAAPNDEDTDGYWARESRA
jgi:hypothetical protein